MDYAFQRVGGKHKGRLLWNLQFKPLRYGALRRLVSGVSTKMLTQALRELEADGLIARHEFAEVPPRVEYTLLPTGAQLVPFINLLRCWAEEQMQAAGVPVLHTNVAYLAETSLPASDAAGGSLANPTCPSARLTQAGGPG